jgi:hypothetical protein
VRKLDDQQQFGRKHNRIKDVEFTSISVENETKIPFSPKMDLKNKKGREKKTSSRPIFKSNGGIQAR